VAARGADDLRRGGKAGPQRAAARRGGSGQQRVSGDRRMAVHQRTQDEPRRRRVPGQRDSGGAGRDEEREEAARAGGGADPDPPLPPGDAGDADDAPGLRPDPAPGNLLRGNLEHRAQEPVQVEDRRRRSEELRGAGEGVLRPPAVPQALVRVDPVFRQGRRTEEGNPAPAPDPGGGEGAGSLRRPGEEGGTGLAHTGLGEDLHDDLVGADAAGGPGAFRRPADGSCSRRTSAA